MKYGSPSKVLCPTTIQLGRQPFALGLSRVSPESSRLLPFCSSTSSAAGISRTRSAGVRVSTDRGSASIRNSQYRRGNLNRDFSEATSCASARPKETLILRLRKVSRRADTASARSLSNARAFQCVRDHCIVRGKSRPRHGQPAGPHTGGAKILGSYPECYGNRIWREGSAKRFMETKMTEYWRRPLQAPDPLNGGPPQLPHSTAFEPPYCGADLGPPVPR